METAAPWKPWKTNCMFSTVPTALGKLGKKSRVFHSSHSLYGWISIDEKRKPFREGLNKIEWTRD
jgi:hypothetical protein